MSSNSKIDEETLLLGADQVKQSIKRYRDKFGLSWRMKGRKSSSQTKRMKSFMCRQLEREMKKL